MKLKKSSNTTTSQSSELKQQTLLTKQSRYAQQMGFPVVLKILSPQIVHKSDVGGVILNIKSESEVREAFELLIQRATAHNPTAQIIGVTVQPMVEKKGP